MAASPARSDARGSTADAQCEPEERRRNVPSPLLAQGPASDVHAAHPQRGLARSTQQPKVQRRQQRQRQHQPQVLGPKEIHLRRQVHHRNAVPCARNRSYCRDNIEHGFWRKRSVPSRARLCLNLQRIAPPLCSGAAVLGFVRSSYAWLAGCLTPGGPARLSLAPAATPIVRSRSEPGCEPPARQARRSSTGVSPCCTTLLCSSSSR